MAELTTIDQLKKRRRQSLRISKKSIREHPAEYREIKRLVRHVISSTIDIGQYYQTAERLTGLLEKMMETGAGSIFSYFYQNIDPKQRGRVRYFRAVCCDLNEQLKGLEQVRLDQQSIRLVQ